MIRFGTCHFSGQEMSVCSSSPSYPSHRIRAPVHMLISVHLHHLICREILATVAIAKGQKADSRRILCIYFPLRPAEVQWMRRPRGAGLGSQLPSTPPGLVWAVRVEDVDDRAKVRSAGGRVVVFVNDSVGPRTRSRRSLIGRAMPEERLSGP